jgi:hypothetical protein
VGGEWSALRHGRFTPGERAPGMHWIRLVDPRAGLDDVEKMGKGRITVCGQKRYMPVFTQKETIQYKHILNSFYLCTKHISIQLNEYDKDNHKKINCIIN